MYVSICVCHKQVVLQCLASSCTLKLFVCVCVCVSVECQVVDESNKLFEDGKSGFREQLAVVFLACSGPRVRRALYSATCAVDVEQWCRLNL